ncbi:MAG: hypothetical protein JWN53_908 [Gemmatimonadetes bacterium]|nr:hypothetical protein [Gemmatimonadota bacterium]
MPVMRFSTRLAALMSAILLVVSCDNRMTAPAPINGVPAVTPGSDVESPTVKIVLTAKPDTVVYLGSSLGVTVTATDNKGVALISTTVRNGGAATIIDSATFSSTPTPVTRQFNLSSTTLSLGDHVIIKTTAADASNNQTTDSLVVVVRDTTTPTVALSSNVLGRTGTVNGLDSIDVNITAVDSAGIATTGYRLLYLRPQGDTVVVFTTAITPVTKTLVYQNNIPFRISDTLPTAGTYAVQGIATDRSGLTVSKPGAIAFRLLDAQAPKVTVLNPGPTGHVAIGDSIFVQVHLTDNSGLKSVSFRGFSVRGNAQLGTQDTVVRYGTVAAPATGSFPPVRDTIITRYLHVTNLDPTPDTLFVEVVATDNSTSGNPAVIRVKVAMVPTITISSTTAGKTLKARDTLDVTVTAGDTTGVRFVGYRLSRVRSTGGDTLVSQDSVAAPASSFSFTNLFKRALLDTLTPGGYILRGFARVSSVAGSPPGLRTIVGSSFTLVDSLKPTATFLTPVEPYRLTVGDSIPVSVHLTDNVGLASVSLVGITVRGDSALGTAKTFVRYPQVTAVAKGRDTVINRYLKAALPVDSTSDTLTVYATVTDSVGLSSTTAVRILMTNGPKVQIISPVIGDSINRGGTFVFTIRASTDIGVTSMSAHLKSAAGWPTPIDTIIQLPFVAPSKDVSVTGRLVIPADAPIQGMLTLSPSAVDVNGQGGASAPFNIFVRSGAAPPPLVKQAIPARMEITDNVSITATGDRISFIGFELRDKTGVIVKRDSVAQANVPQPLAINIGSQYQGQHLAVISFARDSAGRIGYSVSPSATSPQPTYANAFVDSTLIVYGQTFAIPSGRNGIATDVTVDAARGNVFVSNTQYNRLELWSASTNKFDPTGVAVGSLPWGMTMQNDNDTLLVANSGGTNISKVCVNPAACGSIGEVLSQRIQTRNTYVFQVTESRDPATGKIRLSVAGPISYSDRPQYVQQSAGGRVFYSTRPTTFAPKGTIRWLDPKLAVPDPRQIYEYAETAAGNTYALFNADSLGLILAPANSPASDQLVIYDHIYGTKSGGVCNGIPDAICGQDSVVTEAIAKVNAQGGDVVGRLDVDVNALGLSDTTFVASSGDRNWIGFGEGNTGGATSRVMMINDPGGAQPGFFSPAVTVHDLMENAAEPVFGLGIDLHGANVAVHGAQSYFAALENPFHLRLQGKYASFSSGAGIAYHPSADLRSSVVSSSKTDSTRTAFVASSNGSIEVVDAAFFVSRGALQIKNNLYGPLRAALPFPSDNVGIPSTDPRYVVLKLFGLTSTGMVVINLRAQDIQPVP